MATASPDSAKKDETRNADECLKDKDKMPVSEPDGWDREEYFRDFPCTD